MKRSLTTTLSVLMLAVLLAACGVRASNSASPTTTDAGGATTTTPGSSDPSTNPSTDPSASNDPDLASLLPTVDDLPFGWTLDDTTNDDTSGDTQPSCIDDVNTIVGDAPTAEVSFTSDATVEYFTDNLTRIDRAPQRTFNAIADTLDACTDVSFRNNGEEILGMIMPLPFYEYGDDSAAWQLTFATGRAIIDFDIVLVRYGDLIATYTFAALAPLDEETFDDLILSAEDVLAAAGIDTNNPAGPGGGGTDPRSDPRTDPGTDPGDDPGGDVQTA